MIRCRLRILLAEHEMTQKELAQASGVLPNTISKMYNNEMIRVPLEAVDKICSVLECDVGDLYTRKPQSKLPQLS